MKKISKLKVILSMALVLCMSINFCVPTFASERVAVESYSFDRDNVTEEEKQLVGKLISFYGEEHRPDVTKHLEELKEISPEYYEIWNSIMAYWDWIEMDMIENIGVAPDGIQNQEKHAFIVLGFALNSDGTMTDELIGRLEVAKASAEKYPDSYVLVTGGVEKNGWTEGRRMRDWLIENGIDENRIIVEEKAPDTAGNATNSFEMLYNDYDVDTVSLITTQYHLRRGSILYYAESLLKAKELGVEPIKFIGEANAGWYRADKTSESLSLKANSLRSIARVPNINVSGLATAMQGIEVSGRTEYTQGEDLDITVKSIDDKNYNVDLTKYAVVNGFDANKIGEQTIEVSYVQRNKVYEENYTINITETPENLIDRDKLGSLITANENRDLENYTRKSREYFLSVLSEAKQVFENDAATEKEIINVYKKLNSAVNKLIELINIAKNKYVEANFNQADAYKITDNILNTSNYWASMNGGTNAPIDQSNYIIDLNEIHSIDTIKVFPYWGGSRYYHYDVYISEDKENWTKVAEERKEEFCTSEGNTHKLKNVVNARYIKVQGVKTYVAGRPDINNFHVIETQVFGGQAVAFKEHLEIAVEVANKVTEEELSTVVPVVVEEFKKALANAEEVLANEIATQQEVDEAFVRLSNVIQMLEFKKGNKEQLISLVEKIEKLNSEEYINSTWTILETALEASRAVIADENAMEEEVSNTYEGLLRAFLQLRLKPSKDKLQDLISKVEGLDSNKYTQESWNNLQGKLAVAKAVMANEEATENEISEATKTLQLALDSLAFAGGNDNNGGNSGNNGSSNNGGSSNGNSSNKLPNTGGTPAVAVGLLGLLTAATGAVIRRKNNK